MSGPKIIKWRVGHTFQFISQYDCFLLQTNTLTEYVGQPAPYNRQPQLFPACLELPAGGPKLAMIGQRETVERSARVFASGDGGKAFVKPAGVVTLEAGAIDDLPRLTHRLPQELAACGGPHQRRYFAAKFRQYRGADPAVVEDHLCHPRAHSRGDHRSPLVLQFHRGSLFPASIG